MTDGIRLTEIPQSFFDAVKCDLADYSIGFLRIEDTRSGQDPVLLGSGTLVTVEGIHAVLTAHHVIEILPNKGRLGLILTTNLQQYTVDTKELIYRSIARGTMDADGPDLGAVILSPSVAATIAAKKTFYNLTLRRDRMLHTPPDLNGGVWFIHGFVDEMTVVEPGRDGYSQIRGFYSLSGAGGPEETAVSRGEHDYVSFPVSFGCQQVGPISFGGMSGGGLWQVPIAGNSPTNIRAKTPLLWGVVFYQEVGPEAHCAITCHGLTSVYRVAYDVIAPVLFFTINGPKEGGIFHNHLT